ncbi:MAG: PQQ-binding-like beta-propeller repeat protein [Bacillota bacterium]
MKKQGILLVMVLLVFSLMNCFQVNDVKAKDQKDDSKKGYTVSGTVYAKEGYKLNNITISFKGVKNNRDFGTVSTKNGEFTKTGLKGKVKVVPETEDHFFKSKIVTKSTTIKFEEKLKFSFEIDKDEIYMSGDPVVGGDGTIYFGTHKGSLYSGDFGGKLYAIDPNGTKKWEYDVGDSASTPALGKDGTIYINSRVEGYKKEYCLYAINPDGTKKWKYKKHTDSNKPVVGPTGTIYLRGTKSLYAINQNGTEKWRCKIKKDGMLNDSHVAIEKNGSAYAVSNDSLHAVDSNGNKKWTFKAKSSISFTPVIGKKGNIYIADRDNNLYSINSEKNINWVFDIDYIDSAPVIGSDNTIYAGKYVLNSDGTSQFKLKTDTFSNTAISKNGLIFYVDGRHGGNTLIAMDQNKFIKWKFISKKGEVSTPVITEDGMLYVIASNKLNAIKLNSNSL